MTEVVKVFVKVSDARAWVAERIAEVKTQLDEKQTSIFESLERIECEISANNQKYLEEYKQLEAYREQTISLFGPAAANIAVIDSKISEVSMKLSGVGNGSESNCIKVCWSDGALTQLVSSICSARLELDTPVATKEKEPHAPLPPLVKNKPKLKQNFSSDDTISPLASIERYIVSPVHKLSHDSTFAPSRPQEVSQIEPIDFQTESEYVIDSLDSPDEPTAVKTPDSPYTNMSVDGANYYVMNSVPCASLPLEPDRPPRKLSPLPPPQLPTYEDIDGLGEEDNSKLISPPQPLNFPKYPSVVKCPEGAGSGQILKPKTLCVNPSNDNLYVVEKGNCRVQILTPEGDHVKFFGDKSGSHKMSGPYGICIDNNHAYVTQSALNCVHVYTPNGMFVKKFGKEGNKDGRFILPSSITSISAKKQILICDTGNNRVQIFDFSHNFCRLLGVGQLLKPVDIACDDTNKIVVLDRGPKCIHVFGQSGDLMYNTVSFSNFKQLSNPLFMTLSPQGNILLSDYSRNCVFVFSMEGVLLGQIGAEGVFVEPRGLLFAPSGRLVVLSCNHSGCLQFFDV